MPKSQSGITDDLIQDDETEDLRRPKVCAYRLFVDNEMHPSVSFFRTWEKPPTILLFLCPLSGRSRYA